MLHKEGSLKLFNKRIFTYTWFTRSKNYLGHDLDCNLDRNLDCDPEDVPLQHCCSLLSNYSIAIHLISGLKLSRSRSRSGVYMGKIFAIQITILLRVNEVIVNIKINLIMMTPT